MSVPIALLGLGMAAAATYQAIRRDPRFRLAAAYDSNSSALALFNADHASPAFDSFEDFARSDTFQVVSVATPHALHFPQVRELMLNGKDVIVEKPLCLSSEQAAELLEIAQKHSRRLLVGHSYAHGPQYRHIADHIRAGTWGPLHHIAINNWTDFLARPRVFSQEVEAAGGEVLWNQIPHMVDAARVLGIESVRTVDAIATPKGSTSPTCGAWSIQLRCRSGATAHLFYSGEGHFDGNEFNDWIRESGEYRPFGQHRATPVADPAAHRSRLFTYGGPYWRQLAERKESLQQNFGLTLISCEQADIRLTPQGYRVYRRGEVKDVQVATGGPFPGHARMLDAFLQLGKPAHGPIPFSLQWGAETVALIEQIRSSAMQQQAVVLSAA
ncbi:MAG: hypothetical protein RI884_3049 [Pseudomonadota bacterium]|jgi:phthalate 4,5-cis-dihydrodiol dehydrogenase